MGYLVDVRRDLSDSTIEGSHLVGTSFGDRSNVPLQAHGIDPDRRQTLRQVIMQFPGQPAPLIFLGRKKLSGKSLQGSAV